MQIYDGSKWHTVHCYDTPETLDSGAAVQMWDDGAMPYYQAACKASSERTATLFRLKDDEPGHPFWVEVAIHPTLVKDRVMTVLMILTPAAV